MEVFAIKPIHTEPAVMSASEAEFDSWHWDYYDIEDMHSAGYTGRGVSIGVVDTGVPQHVDIDVFNGFDARRGFSPQGNNKFDVDQHSTHVSGIIGARHDGKGTRGVMIEPKLHIAKGLGDNGSGSLADIIRAGDLLASQGVKVCNLSLGWNGKMPLSFDEAIKRWYKSGMIVVAAAGNDGKHDHLDNPSKHPLVVCAGSHDKNGNRSTFSDTGDMLDVYGPGDRVLSTYGREQYQIMSGTSMSTPFVAGLIAVFYKHIVQKYGKITVDIIGDLLIEKRI